MGTSCTEKADIYSCVPPCRCLSIRAHARITLLYLMRPARCGGWPAPYSLGRARYAGGAGAGSVPVQECADVRVLLRRLGVTVWEICTGDQPKRGQLRACRRGPLALPGMLAHVQFLFNFLGTIMFYI